MNPSSNNEAPDAEVEDLFTRHLDQRLDEAGRTRLEQRIRDEPAVRAYCARRLRFEAELHDTLHPQTMEWLETRRVVVSQDGPHPEWEVQRTQTVRYGNPETPRQPAELAIPPARKRPRLWWWLVLIVALTAAILWLFLRDDRNQKQTPSGATSSPLVLRNPGFEITDLALSPRGTSLTLMDWQDYFTTPRSELCEINRVSAGAIFAKSGRNVARLQPSSYLTQHLRRQDGSPVLAKPGMRFKVTGWAYTQGRPPYAMRSAIRFVASSRPDQIQYEATGTQIPLQEGGWQPFTIELVLPSDLTLPTSYVENVPSAPKLDLAGRELTLSVDSRCGEFLLLDDLQIEELPSE